MKYVFGILIFLSATAFVAPQIDEWKNWKTVANWTFGVDRGEVPMIADADALHPYMAQLTEKMLQTLKNQGLDVRIVETYRTRTKQAEYYGMGPGYTASAAGQSKHQFGLAIDVVPFVGGAAVWDDKKLWEKIGKAGEELGFRWGGRWKKPYDPGHFEWTGGLTAENLKKGQEPKIPASANIPDIAEKLKKLKENQEALEKYHKDNFSHLLKKKK
jgi:hypothetical protein